MFDAGSFHVDVGVELFEDLGQRVADAPYGADAEVVVHLGEDGVELLPSLALLVRRQLWTREQVTHGDGATDTGTGYTRGRSY